MNKDKLSGLGGEGRVPALMQGCSDRIINLPKAGCRGGTFLFEKQ